MKRNDVKTTLNDRERILTRVIDGLRSTAILRARSDPYNEEQYRDGSGGYYVHFAVYRKPIKGDLVIGQTGRDLQWKIAFYEDIADPAQELHVVRDINTGQLCNYGNEAFTPIVGLNYTDLLTGQERAMFEKVMAAFARGDEYSYRYGGFRIDGDTATITVREAHGGFGRESIPFSIQMKWTPKTTIKQVLECMRAGGYGTKSFRPEQPASPPTLPA